jgi:hypothetical protein
VTKPSEGNKQQGALGLLSEYEDRGITLHSHVDEVLSDYKALALFTTMGIRSGVVG